MKSLTNYISEKLIINKNYKQVYTCTPKSFNELREIIEQRYEEQGPGTEKEPIDFNDINISKINSFYDGHTGIFKGTEFEYIDISDWDVSKVKNMRSMFACCERLKSIGNLSNWNVSNVENMISMFDGCEKLESVGDLSNWNVSSVEYVNFMFWYCKKLESVGDLSNWNVSNVKDKNCMFKNSAITNIPDWYKE